jgi:hypothetical protein
MKVRELIRERRPAPEEVPNALAAGLSSGSGALGITPAQAALLAKQSESDIMRRLIWRPLILHGRRPLFKCGARELWQKTDRRVAALLKREVRHERRYPSQIRGDYRDL